MCCFDIVSQHPEGTSTNINSHDQRTEIQRSSVFAHIVPAVNKERNNVKRRKEITVDKYPEANKQKTKTGDHNPLPLPVLAAEFPLPGPSSTDACQTDHGHIHTQWIWMDFRGF